jgi:hypothetical protein
MTAKTCGNPACKVECDADDKRCMDCGYNFQTGCMPGDSIGESGQERDAGQGPVRDQPADHIEDSRVAAATAAPGVKAEAYRPAAAMETVIGGDDGESDDGEPAELFGASDAVQPVEPAEPDKLAAEDVAPKPIQNEAATTSGSTVRPAFLDKKSGGPTIPDAVWKLERPRGPHLVIWVSHEPRPGRPAGYVLPPERDPVVVSLTEPWVLFGRAKPAMPNDSYIWIEFADGIGAKMPHGQFDRQLSGGYTLALAHNNGAWVYRKAEMIRQKPVHKPLRLLHGDVIAIGCCATALYLEPEEDEDEGD